MLPLDRFFELVSFSPLLSNQVQLPANVAGDDMQPLGPCEDAILQYTWQARTGGMPSREEIALAIAQAEGVITSHLHFPPVPVWIADETDIPARGVPGAWAGYTPFGGVTVRPYLLQLQLQQKQVIYGGKEAWSVIQAGRAITYSDPDGDGYNELATVTATTTITDASEIAVMYPGKDPVVDATWEIRPITVSFSAGVATITFKRHQAVLATLLEQISASALNGYTDANFLTTVDVYRHYNDPSTMAIVEWSPAICDDAACEVEAQTGCFTQVDPRSGVVSVHAADWVTADSEWVHVWPTWWQRPTRVRTWYRAGYRDQSKKQPFNQMYLQFEQAIAYLALTYMDRTWEACEPLHNLQGRWRTDLAQRQSNPSQSVSWNISRGQLDNPLGTTRAAVFAWSVIQQFAVGEAVLAS